MSTQEEDFERTKARLRDAIGEESETNWSEKYHISKNVEACIDDFAIRGMPSISIPSVDDIARLDKLKKVLDSEGKSLPKGFLTLILVNEYEFEQEHAEYIEKTYIVN